MNINVPLDEETAVALCMQIENQIQALKVWKRKLTLPFSPAATHTYPYPYRTTPVYPTPTVGTMWHIANAQMNAARLNLHLLQKFADNNMEKYYAQRAEEFDHRIK
jgi:hypothetical protein